MEDYYQLVLHHESQSLTDYSVAQHSLQNNPKTPFSCPLHHYVLRFQYTAMDTENAPYNHTFSSQSKKRTTQTKQKAHKSTKIASLAFQGK